MTHDIRKTQIVMLTGGGGFTPMVDYILNLDKDTEVTIVTETHDDGSTTGTLLEIFNHYNDLYLVPTGDLRNQYANLVYATLLQDGKNDLGDKIYALLQDKVAGIENIAQRAHAAMAILGFGPGVSKTIDNFIDEIKLRWQGMHEETGEIPELINKPGNIILSGILWGKAQQLIKEGVLDLVEIGVHAQKGLVDELRETGYIPYNVDFRFTYPARTLLSGCTVRGNYYEGEAVIDEEVTDPIMVNQYQSYDSRSGKKLNAGAIDLSLQATLRNAHLLLLPPSSQANFHAFLINARPYIETNRVVKILNLATGQNEVPREIELAHLICNLGFEHVVALDVNDIVDRNNQVQRSTEEMSLAYQREGKSLHIYGNLNSLGVEREMDEFVSDLVPEPSAFMVGSRKDVIYRPEISNTLGFDPKDITGDIISGGTYSILRLVVHETSEPGVDGSNARLFRGFRHHGKFVDISMRHIVDSIRSGTFETLVDPNVHSLNEANFIQRLNRENLY